MCSQVANWTRDIEEALRMDRLVAGEASKVAGATLTQGDYLNIAVCCAPVGRLAFAAQHIFKRLGRAMLVPIYKHMRSRSSNIGFELRLALRWWLQTLKRGMCEVCCTLCHCPRVSPSTGAWQGRPWDLGKVKPVHLLCDARRVAATSNARICSLFPCFSA